MLAIFYDFPEKEKLENNKLSITVVIKLTGKK